MDGARAGPRGHAELAAVSGVARPRSKFPDGQTGLQRVGALTAGRPVSDGRARQAVGLGAHTPRETQAPSLLSLSSGHTWTRALPADPSPLRGGPRPHCISVRRAGAARAAGSAGPSAGGRRRGPRRGSAAGGGGRAHGVPGRGSVPVRREGAGRCWGEEVTRTDFHQFLGEDRLRALRRTEETEPDPGGCNGRGGHQRAHPLCEDLSRNQERSKGVALGHTQRVVGRTGRGAGGGGVACDRAVSSDNFGGRCVPKGDVTTGKDGVFLRVGLSPHSAHSGRS